jgi:hypothetical protein
MTTDFVVKANKEESSARETAGKLSVGWTVRPNSVLSDGYGNSGVKK